MAKGPLWSLLMLVVCTDRAQCSYSSSPWTVSTASGTVDLIFNRQPILSGACPTFKLADQQHILISACDRSRFAAGELLLLPKTPFTDSLLGNSSTAIVQFKSIVPSIPSANLTLVLFWRPETTASILLSFSKPIHTNWVSPLYGAKWKLGSGSGATRLLKVPADNDIISMYQTVDPGELMTCLARTRLK